MSYGRIITVPLNELLKDDLDPSIVCPHCSKVIALESLSVPLEGGWKVPFGIYECACGGRFDFGPGMSVRSIPREEKE